MVMLNYFVVKGKQFGALCWKPKTGLYLLFGVFIIAATNLEEHIFYGYSQPASAKVDFCALYVYVPTLAICEDFSKPQHNDANRDMRGDADHSVDDRDDPGGSVP